MRAFSIAFLPPTEQGHQDPNTRIGLIQIGDFQERFEASLEFWTQEEYESQWAKAIDRLGAQARTSCLITSLTDPATANFLFWWPMYLLGQDIHIQHHALFLSDIKGTFDPSDPYAHIPERSPANEDGEPISEWVISLSDLAGAGRALFGVASPTLATDNPIRSYQPGR